MSRSDFHDVELVHVDVGLAAITSVSSESVTYTDELGQQRTVDLNESAENFTRLSTDSPSDHFVARCAVYDKPPWFQFLNNRRTQFEFKNSQHILQVLVGPVARFRWGISDDSQVF